MAIVATNSLFNGASGKMGDVVFRTRNGKTYMTRAPQRKAGNHTSQQMKQQKKFHRCVNYAKEAIKDAAVKDMYAAEAVKGQSAYNVAFADAYNAPQVHSIDISRYRGRKGNSIIVEAIDDFKVATVQVSIHSKKGELIEQGEAVFEDDLNWKYVVIKNIKDYAGCTISATATDLPGNEGSLEVKKEESIWKKFSLLRKG